MNLVRIQFIVSVVLYLLCVIFLPGMGFSGLVMQIYPCLAAGYFILFLLYAELIFLYYFNDMTGALLTAVCFCLGTFLERCFQNSFLISGMVQDLSWEVSLALPSDISGFAGWNAIWMYIFSARVNCLR